MRFPSGSVTVLFWIALLAPLSALVFLYGLGPVFSQDVWSPEGLQRFENYTVAFAAISLGVGLFCRRYFLPLLLVSILICSAVAVGPVPIVAVLFFVFSCTVLGRVVFERSLEGPLALCGGMAIWILAMNFTARVPIHYAAVYLALLALPVAIGYSHSRRLAAQWLGLFRPGSISSVPECFTLALLAFVMVAQWLLVLKPEVSADALSMHMAIASNIAVHHAFTIDFRDLVWGLMPMGGDWAYSILYMLGGEYAARLLNFAMLVTIGVFLFCAARRFVSKAVAMLMVFLFMSTPMAQLATTAMFVENFVAVMLLAALVALWKYHEEGTAQSLILTAVLLGTSAALKLGGLAVALVFLPLLIALMLRKQLLHPVIRIGAVAILVAIGVMPYAYAYWQSGSPVFPFNNARFESPYVEDDIIDERFQQSLSWRTPVQLTLQTHLYYEGLDGSFGFQYFLFLPLMLICLIPMRSFPGLSAAILGFGAAVVIAAIQPNARYLYPTLPFLTLGFTAALSSVRTTGRPLFLACLAVSMLAGLGNAYMLPSSSWYHRGFYSAPLFSASGRQAYLEENSPLREAIRYVNGVNGTRPVVFMDSSMMADLVAPAYSNTWHGYRFLKQLRLADDPEDIYRLLSGLGAHDIILEPNENRGRAMEVFFAACGETKYSLAGVSVVSIFPDCESRLRRWGSMPLTVGKHDDTQMNITTQGNWTVDRNLPSAYHEGVSYSDEPDALVRFTFTGRGFKYGYTKAFNRGMAEILIDGSQKSVVDLYSSEIQWQVQTTIDGLSDSAHDVTIRVLHDRHPAASGYFIDIDFVEIF